MEKDDVLRKVRALLDRADHPNTPPAEAEQSRLKADSLMQTYAIESFMVDLERQKAGKKSLQTPELRTFSYGRIGVREADDMLVRLFSVLARHCGVKLGFYGWSESKIVGYPADLDYLELLYTSVRMHMSANLTPTIDPNLSDGANVAKMKEAGYKWDKIYTLMGSSLYDENGKKRNHLFNAYKKFCKEHNLSHIGIHPDLYLRSFVQGYVEEVNSRIWSMDRARKNEAQGSGMELVLRNRDDLLQEAFYDHFPNQRPHPKDCDCDVCHATRCTDRNCQRKLCVEMRKPIRYRKMATKAVDASAMNAGRSAGAKVDLSGGRGVAPRRREVEG